MVNVNDKQLTEIQKNIINSNNKELLIRGMPGSGKSIVLLKRAVKQAYNNPNEKYAIFAYNKPLVQSMKFLIEKYGLNNLEVHTFHGWAKSNFTRITRRGNRVNSNTQIFLENTLKSLQGKYSNRFVEDEQYKDFLLEEFSWIKSRGITSKREYLDVQRKGRGTKISLSKNDREVIYIIFEGISERKKGILDFDDLGYEIYKCIDTIPGDIKFDHVFVDEAQDLQMIQLQILRKISRDTICIAADIGQKIYKTYFTWKEIGINIQGNRTMTLSESFRSTEQIIKFASDIQRKDAISKDLEFVSPVLPQVQGPKPIIVHTKSKAKQNIAIIEFVRDYQRDNPGKSIALLTRYNYTLRYFKIDLDANHIKYEELNEESTNPYTSGVKIGTFHSSKGLEFDAVILFELKDSKYISSDDYEEIDVERRLLYVASTRAKVELYLYTYGEKYLKLIEDFEEENYVSKEI